MKNLKEIISEAVKTSKWESMHHMGAGQFHKDVKFIRINTQDNMITWWDEDEVESWEDEDLMSPKDVHSILALGPGELFDADGGINIYIRFKN